MLQLTLYQLSQKFYLKTIVNLSRKVTLSIILILLFITSESVMTEQTVGKIIFQADTFSSVETAISAGWSQNSQREETRPRFFIGDFPNLEGIGSLGISGNSNNLTNGYWSIMVPGILGGKYYRFDSSYFARSITYPNIHVLAILDWYNEKGERLYPPVYVPDSDKIDNWQKVSGIFRAPKDATSLSIQLYLRFSDQGTVLWDDIKLTEVTTPHKRIVRIATVNCFPSNNFPGSVNYKTPRSEKFNWLSNHSTSAESVEEFCSVAEEAGKNGCDIVCLGEGVNFYGVKDVTYADIAEPIPGPTTDRLGEIARKWKMYIVASLGEQDGRAVHNTAVLINRRGKVIGKYRKTHVPRQELDSGVTPGNSYPVFDVDFGRIGMLVCWDNQFSEAPRALVNQGAEIIFMPIEGGFTDITRVHALEYQVYFVSSGYTIQSTIYDRWGKMIAEADKRPGIAFVDIDLNEPQLDNFLGDMRYRRIRKLRPDIQIPKQR